MRVTCEYCDSYVDIDTESVCPLCGAPLGDVLRAAQRRAAEEAQRRADEEKARAEKEAEQQKQQMILSTISNIAGVAAGTILGTAVRHTFRGPKPLLGKGLFGGRKR